MYSLQQFKNENAGQLVMSRGGIKGQCVSLAQRWAEVNGVGGAPVFPVANARNMGPNTRQDAFTWIPNKVGDPNSKPSPGDIVVFSWNHTGIAESSDGYTMTLFEQNDPTGSGAHSKNYSFNGCTGWLRLKQAPAPQGGTVADVTTTVEEMRIIHTEEEGWPLHETHQGKYDAQFMASWGGHGLREMVWEKWNKNGNWRNTRQAALDYYGTKAANDKLIQDLKNQVFQQQAQIVELNNQIKNPPAASQEQAAQTVAEVIKPAYSFWQKILPFLRK